MKRFLLLLFLWPLLLPAATYTASWCPVTGAQQYAVCVSSSGATIFYGGQQAQFTSPPCNGTVLWTMQTKISVDLPTNGWVQVLAESVEFNWIAGTVSFAYSGYSNPVHIVDGLTPPAVGGCP